MVRSTVAVLKTSPNTVIEDYLRLFQLADYRNTINPRRDLAAHITLAWHPFFPSVSSPPWQIDGALGAALTEEFPAGRALAWYDDTAGASLSKGRVLNRHITALDRYGVPSMSIDEGERRIYMKPTKRLPALEKIFAGGIPVPECLMGRNLLFLPTMKIDKITTINGATRNIFEGILGLESKRAGGGIHEAIVESLAVSRQIGASIFSVMDAVFAGEGPNPREIIPHETNLLLASGDPVALDAVALRIMGFDPMETPFIRYAHEAGLGAADPGEIEIIGDEISDISLGFTIIEPKGARRIQALKHWTHGTVFEPISGFVALAYYDWYRYMKFGEKRISDAMRGPWGIVFENYRRTNSH